MKKVTLNAIELLNDEKNTEPFTRFIDNCLEKNPVFGSQLTGCVA